MFVILIRSGSAALLAGLLMVGSATAQRAPIPPYDRDAPPGPPPPVPGFEGTPQTGEVQARGPIHEAFAQPSESMTRPGPLVPKAPPEPIQELPPDQKPEGDNVVWIPGYWSWDADRNDYLWISGAWRVVPAGRKWVPGYWNKADAGWRWVSGFWAGAGASDLPFVDPPPASLDHGPSLPPAGENEFYVPGTWLYRDERYLWRPGYWSVVRPGLVYVPPRYVWTPGGTLFVSGYWDVPLEDRGVLFAPVYFSPTLYVRTGWWYRPRYTVAVPALLSSLWIYPGAGYYAFGDYYGAISARRGFYPWVSYGRSYRDPLYGYYRWRYRGNPAWERGLLATYRGRVAGTVALPPRTLVAQQRLLASSRTASPDLRVVQPLSQFRSGSLRLNTVTAAQFTSSARLAAGYRKTSVERSAFEARANRTSTTRAAHLGRVPTGPSISTVRPARARTPSSSRPITHAPVTTGPRTSASASRTSRPGVSSRGPTRSATLPRATPPRRPAAAPRGAPPRAAPARRGATPYRSAPPARRPAPSKSSGHGHK
jgi:hypothetical protein